MPLRWNDERYVRVYVRDTVDWLMMPWQSRAMFPLLLRKVDRAGVIDTGRFGASGLAATLGLPQDVVDVGLAGLLDDGCVLKDDARLVVRNFVEAQETPASDAKRKREERERARAVTPSHAVSRDVTPIRADLCLTEPSQAEEQEPPAAAPLDFDAVYALYPRKQGRKKGHQRFKTQITTRAKYDALVTAVKHYVAIVADKDPEYVKHFDTFMNCWEDYVEAPKLAPRAAKAPGFAAPMAPVAQGGKVKL